MLGTWTMYLSWRCLVNWACVSDIDMLPGWDSCEVYRDLRWNVIWYLSVFSICQTHGQDLSTISPASIFESMFQSPDHTTNQEDSKQTGTNCFCTILRESFFDSFPSLRASVWISNSDWKLLPHINLSSKPTTSASVLKYFCVEIHSRMV